MSESVIFGGQGQYNTPAEVNFQEFSYAQQPDAQPGGYSQQYQYDPSFSSDDGKVTFQSIKSAFGTGDIQGEPPLLEELGINFTHIFKKSVAVLNPVHAVDSHILDDTDLAGPLIFCLLFGVFLLLAGKAHFGFIYGVAALGWLSMYVILNLMSDTGIDVYRCASVLGYSLLPMVLLSSISSLFHLTGTIGLGISAISVLWCANSASAMFAAYMNAADQRLLIAYPVGLFFGSFALLAVF